LEEGSALEGVELTSGPADFWQRKRVLVTGATGIVGSWMVRELLDRGAEVTALVLDAEPQSEIYRRGYLQKIHVVNGKLEDFRAIERAVLLHECDTVIHLGAQAIVSIALQSPRQTFETNIRGTWNLLEVCRLHAGGVKRVIVASSDKAYGEQRELPYTEESRLQGRFPYEVSKSCADLIAQSYFHSYGLPVAVARCGNIYGGGDFNWNRIVPGTIRSFYYHESPIIRSDGRFVRDYVYVKDVVDAFLRLAEELERPEVRGRGFNFSPQSRVTVLEMVECIQRLMHREAIQPKILNQAKGEIRHQYLSSARAAEILKWQPRYTLEQGLKETIDWYQSYFAETGS
jgi:CDP-glucose 4,6-dehydratase